VKKRKHNDDDEYRKLDATNNKLDQTFPTYQFIYLGTKHLIIKLQKGLCYLKTWYLQNKQVILNSHVKYLIVHGFKDQFNLSQEEWSDLREDEFETLARNEQTIDEITDKDINHNNNNDDDDNNALRAQLQHEENMKHINDNNDDDDDNGLNNSNKMNYTSRLQKLEKEIKELYPDQKTLIEYGLDKDLLNLFKQHSDKYRNSSSNNNNNNNNGSSITNDSFFNMIYPDEGKYKCGSLTNLTKEQMELELCYPGTLTNTPLAEEELKQVQNTFNIKHKSEEINMKEIKALYFIKPRINNNNNNNDHNDHLNKRRKFKFMNNNNKKRFKR